MATALENLVHARLMMLKWEQRQEKEKRREGA